MERFKWLAIPVEDVREAIKEKFQIDVIDERPIYNLKKRRGEMLLIIRGRDIRPEEVF